MADLALGAIQTGVGVAQIIAFIIKTSEQAHHLKEECRKINAAATTLQNCLANRKGIEGIEAGSSLESLLTEVAGVVSKCKQSNFLKRAWEVAWRQKIPALVKEMMMWSAILNIEVSVRHPLYD